LQNVKPFVFDMVQKLCFQRRHINISTFALQLATQHTNQILHTPYDEFILYLNGLNILQAASKFVGVFSLRVARNSTHRPTC
jgi:hypothetical protein